MKRLTLMFLVPDRARADVALTADRIYCRFATEYSIDDNELPGLKERFDEVAETILGLFRVCDGECVVDPSEVKVSVFVDNREHKLDGVTDGGLRRVCAELEKIDECFGFVRGFC